LSAYRPIGRLPDRADSRTDAGSYPLGYSIVMTAIRSAGHRSVGRGVPAPL